MEKMWFIEKKAIHNIWILNEIDCFVHWTRKLKVMQCNCSHFGDVYYTPFLNELACAIFIKMPFDSLAWMDVNQQCRSFKW